jgi:hypothetical protein
MCAGSVFHFLVFVEISIIHFFPGQCAIGTAELDTLKGVSFSRLAFLNKRLLLLVVAASLIAIPFPWLARRVLRVIWIVPGLIRAGSIAFGHDGSAVGLTD